MLHTLRAILLACSLSVVGCAVFAPTADTNKVAAPPSQIFYANYDEVWRAIQKSLVKYPMLVNNIDQGVIETDIVRGKPVWQSPIPSKQDKLNAKYAIKILVVKGMSKGKDSVRVTVNKNIRLEKDFFSGENQLSSDGLEEMAILYRIDREITLERSMRRAFEKRK